MSATEAEADAWSVLGLQPSASQYEIKQRFRKLALKYHPDKQTGSSVSERSRAEEEFKRIGAAYECVTKIAERKTNAASSSSSSSSHGDDNNSFESFTSFASFADYFFHLVRQVDAQVRRQQRVPFAASLVEMYVGQPVEVELPRHRQPCIACKGVTTTTAATTANVPFSHHPRTTQDNPFQSACSTFLQHLTSPETPGWTSALHLASSGMVMLAYAHSGGGGHAFNPSTNAATQSSTTNDLTTSSRSTSFATAGSSNLPTSTYHPSSNRSCTVCNGAGWTHERLVCTLRIPPRCIPGTELVFPGQAEYQYACSSGEPGDLVFVLEDIVDRGHRCTCTTRDGRVGTWTRSTRDSSRWCLALPMSLHEALATTTTCLELKHLDGHRFTVLLPPLNDGRTVWTGRVISLAEHVEVKYYLQLPTPEEIAGASPALSTALESLRQFRQPHNHAPSP